MRMVVLMMVFGVLSCLVITVYGQGVKDNTEMKMTEEDKQRGQRIMELFQKADTDILFYGLVEDQNGVGVSGATVVAGVTCFSLDPKALMFTGIKTVTAITDDHGYFQIKGVMGRDIGIDKVEQAGYEFRYDQNTNRSFGSNRNVPLPTKKKPAIFHLRKKGETAFLIEQKYLDLGYSVELRGAAIGYDVIKKVRQRSDRLMLNDEPVTFDLLLSGTFDAAKQEWTVTLAPGTKGGGIIVSDKMLYEAPKDGYQPNCNLALPCVEVPKERRPELQDGWMVGKHIYLKSRNPAIYSRFSITHSRADKGGIYLSFSASTNPYGEWCLDEATDIPGEIYIRLGKEVGQAFRAGRRPAKPDFKKLVEEAEKQKTER